MARVSTSELSGAALDWAVAKASRRLDSWILDGRLPGTSIIDITVHERRRVVVWAGSSGHPAPRTKADLRDYVPWAPSTDWAQGGPILDRERINLEPFRDINGDQWSADGAWNSPTPLVAAMRCYVASKLGDEVDVPEELAC